MASDWCADKPEGCKESHVQTYSAIPNKCIRQIILLWLCGAALCCEKPKTSVSCKVPWSGPSYKKKSSKRVLIPEQCKGLDYIQMNDGISIVNVNRDDASGFRLDTLATHNTCPDLEHLNQ